MKPIYTITMISLLLPLLFFSAGCATTENENKNADINLEARIKNAEAVKASLLKELENPKDVNEIVMIKDQLTQVQEEIDSLKAQQTTGNPTKQQEQQEKNQDGFKDTKERKITYGPLGFVLQLTQWILEKLYIIHEK